MTFKDIKIENFRGIHYAEIKGLKRVNLFVGTNNCGKTSVLEAIYTLANFSSPFDFRSTNIMRGYTNFNYESLDLHFYNRNFHNRVIISGTTDNNNSRKLEITPFKRNKVSISTKDSKLDSFNSFDKNKEFDSLIFSYSTIQEDTILFRGEASIGIDSSEEESISITTDSTYTEETTSFLIPPSIDRLELGKLLAKLLENKLKDELITLIKEIDPNISDIMTNSNNEILVDIGVDKFIPINMMGDGVRRFLSLIIFLYGLGNGIIFIDEIDNGLHYSAIHKMWKLVLSISAKRNIQVFATSHSLDSLRAINTLMQNDENTDENIICYNLTHFDNGELVAYDYDKNSFNFQLNNDIEIR